MKSAVVHVRLSEEEKADIERQAKVSGLSTSDYIRRRIFGIKIEPRLPKTDEKTVILLRQIGGLIKQLYARNIGNPSDTWNVLKELNETLKYIRSNRNDCQKDEK